MSKLVTITENGVNRSPEGTRWALVHDGTTVKFKRRVKGTVATTQNLECFTLERDIADRIEELELIDIVISTPEPTSLQLQLAALDEQLKQLNNNN